VIFTAVAILIIAIPLTPMILRDLRRASQRKWPHIFYGVNDAMVEFSVAAQEAVMAMRRFSKALERVVEK
jgi:hypothetical protein